MSFSFYTAAKLNHSHTHTRIHMCAAVDDDGWQYCCTVQLPGICVPGEDEKARVRRNSQSTRPVAGPKKSGWLDWANRRVAYPNPRYKSSMKPGPGVKHATVILPLAFAL